MSNTAATGEGFSSTMSVTARTVRPSLKVASTAMGTARCSAGRTGAASDGSPAGWTGAAEEASADFVPGGAGGGVSARDGEGSAGHDELQAVHRFPLVFFCLVLVRRALSMPILGDSRNSGSAFVHATRASAVREEGARGGKASAELGSKGERLRRRPAQCFGLPLAFQRVPSPGLSPGGCGEPRIVPRRDGTSTLPAARPRCRTPRDRPLCAGRGGQPLHTLGRGGKVLGLPPRAPARSSAGRRATRRKEGGVPKSRPRKQARARQVVHSWLNADEKQEARDLGARLQQGDAMRCRNWSCASCGRPRTTSTSPNGSRKWCGT